MRLSAWAKMALCASLILIACSFSHLPQAVKVAMFLLASFLWMLVAVEKLFLPTKKGTTSDFLPGTYLVIGTVYDSVPVKGGGQEIDVVLALRRLENGSRERLIYVFGEDLTGDPLSPFRSALSKNRPAFRFLVEPDGQSAILYQEDPSDGEWLYELKLDLNK